MSSNNDLNASPKLEITLKGPGTPTYDTLSQRGRTWRVVNEQRVLFTTKYTSVSLSLKQGGFTRDLNCNSSQVMLSKLQFCTKSKFVPPSYTQVHRDCSLSLLDSCSCKL
jgi:hypothetical protein